LIRLCIQKNADGIRILVTPVHQKIILFEKEITKFEHLLSLENRDERNMFVSDTTLLKRNM